MNRTELMTEVAEGFSSFKRLMVTSQAHGHAKRMTTHAQIGILFILSHGGPMSLKAIAERLCMTSSAATQLVNGLVEDKMITRREDETDRRKIVLTLTATGKNALAAAKKARLSALTALLEPLSDAELLQWKTLQDKILEHRQQNV